MTRTPTSHHHLESFAGDYCVPPLETASVLDLVRLDNRLSFVDVGLHVEKSKTMSLFMVQYGERKEVCNNWEMLYQEPVIRE